MKINTLFFLLAAASSTMHAGQQKFQLDTFMMDHIVAQAQKGYKKKAKCGTTKWSYTDQSNITYVVKKGKEDADLAFVYVEYPAFSQPGAFPNYFSELTSIIINAVPQRQKAHGLLRENPEIASFLQEAKKLEFNCKRCCLITKTTIFNKARDIIKTGLGYDRGLGLPIDIIACKK